MASSADEVLAVLAEDFTKAAAAGEFDAALDEFMENDVVPIWQGYAPVETGKYRDSIGVTQPAHAGKGQVGATDDVANLIEYGSIHNPEWAPRAKTIEHFNREGAAPQ
jgi:hypothetical protein